MQICASTDNLSAPASLRPCPAWHPSSQRFEQPGPICVCTVMARLGRAWQGQARRGRAGQGDVIALIPAFRAMRAEAWQG